MLHSRNPSLQTLSRGLDRGTGARGGERANGWGAKSSTLLQDGPQQPAQSQHGPRDPSAELPGLRPPTRTKGLLTNLSPCLQKRDNSFFHSRLEAE